MEAQQVREILVRKHVEGKKLSKKNAAFSLLKMEQASCAVK